MEIRPLNAEEQSALTEMFELAARLVDHTLPLSSEEAQELYDVLLQDKPDFPAAKVAVGLVFGDFLVRRGACDWVRVTDAQGAETGLCLKGWEVVCFPISMIQKRLHRDEVIDLSQLVDATITSLNEMAATGDYKAR